MAITTLSSRAFDKHVRRAKKAAKGGPVFINERGKPAYVLLTIESYEELGGEQVSITSEKAVVANPSKRSIIDMLAMPPGIEDVELEIPRDRSTPRPADFD